MIFVPDECTYQECILILELLCHQGMPFVKLSDVTYSMYVCGKEVVMSVPALIKSWIHHCTG